MSSTLAVQEITKQTDKCRMFNVNKAAAIGTTWVIWVEFVGVKWDTNDGGRVWEQRNGGYEPHLFCCVSYNKVKTLEWHQSKTL